MSIIYGFTRGSGDIQAMARYQVSRRNYVYGTSNDAGWESVELNYRSLQRSAVSAGIVEFMGGTNPNRFTLDTFYKYPYEEAVMPLTALLTKLEQSKTYDFIIVQTASQHYDAFSEHHRLSFGCAAAQDIERIIIARIAPHFVPSLATKDVRAFIYNSYYIDKALHLGAITFDDLADQMVSTIPIRASARITLGAPEITLL